MKGKMLNLKEFVIVLLLACVEAAIALVATIPFAANMQLVYFLAPGLAGLINGIVYVLLVKKCPKIGTQFIVPMVYGLYFLFTGSVYVFVFFAILAAANELIMLGGGYQSRIRPAIPHALTWMLNAMGSTLTMLLSATVWCKAMWPWGWTPPVRTRPSRLWKGSGWLRRTSPPPWLPPQLCPLPDMRWA